MANAVPLSSDATPPGTPATEADEGEWSAVKGASEIKAGIKAAAASVTKTAGGGSKFEEQLRELQAWEQPYNSAMALGGVLTVFYLTFGPAGWGLVSLACYTAATRLVLAYQLNKALNALKENEKAKAVKGLLERALTMLEGTLWIPDEASVKSLVRGVAGLVEARLVSAAALMNAASKADEKGRKALRTALAHMAGLLVLLWFFSLWTLTFLYAVHQLVWPATYARHQERIDEMAARAWTKMEPHVAKAQEHLSKLEANVSAKGAEVAEVAAQKARELAEKLLAKFHERFPKAGAADGADATDAKAAEAKSE